MTEEKSQIVYCFNFDKESIHYTKTATIINVFYKNFKLHFELLYKNLEDSVEKKDIIEEVPVDCFYSNWYNSSKEEYEHCLRKYKEAIEANLIDKKYYLIKGEDYRQYFA